MALYVDSAFLHDIMNVARTVPLSGVTTNPTILLAAHERGQNLHPQAVLEALLQGLSGTIFMQPGATEEEEMYQQAMAYIGTDPARVIPKIPMTHTGVRVARRLRRQNFAIAFTAVSSVAQAYSAAIVQADFIIPYYNRLQRSGVDASERISHMAKLLHRYSFPTRILAASIKSPEDATQALLAGAHDLTVAPAVLLAMLTDPLSEEAVEKFTQDWLKLSLQK